MAQLNTADRLYIGTGQASAAYVGSTKVWPAFKPTDLSGCVIWLDASKLALSFGAAVNTWTNLGSGPNPTLVGSPAPVFRTNQLNFIMPVVRQTGGQGRFQFAGTGIDKEWTIVYLARRWSLKAGRVLAANYTATSSNILIGFHGTEMDCAYVEGWYSPIISGVTSGTTWRLYSADSSASGASRFWSNGNLRGTHPAAPPAKGWGGSLILGGWDDARSQDPDADYAEVVMYNRRLTDTERQQVEGYLRVKWAPLAFRPDDLGMTLSGWFDASDPSTVQIVGSGVNQWINKAGSIALTQSNDAYRPKYANQTVTLTSPQAFSAANSPTSYDVVFVGRPHPSSNGEWRTLLRGAAPHQIIIEAGATRFGTYNGGFFPAATAVSPSNMTSDTAPAPFVVSSDPTMGGYPASLSFDGNASTYSHSASPVATTPYWIKIDLGSSRYVNQYSYQARSDSATGSPPPYQQWKSWILQGSNDNFIWNLVDTVNNETNYALSEKRTYVCDNPAAYRYWKWTVSVGTGYDPPYAASAELSLSESLTWSNVWGIGFGRMGTSGPTMLSRDGGALASTGTTLAAGNVEFICFGAYQGPPPSQSFGDIKEVIFLTYNLEAARPLLEGYLAHRHGLASLLPATHFYKDYPP